MMKAKELLGNTLKLLGYSDNDGNVELTSRIRNKAIVAVNLVYGDLWRAHGNGDFEPIKSLEDVIKLSSDVMNDIFLYGLAMHIARSENDGDQQQYFTQLYNARRAGMTQYTSVKNVIPHPED